MLILLSPSKTIDFQSAAPPLETTWPLFASKAIDLVRKIRCFTAEEIALRERVSLKIAFATRDYAHSFSFIQRTGKAALFAYDGNVYDKLEAMSLSPEDILFTQNHLRIFSALYGVLRPLDKIQAYRLDMNSKLMDGLYDLWKDAVTREVAKLLRNDDRILVNLASAEYFKLVDPKLLPAKRRIITPVFKQEYNGAYTVNSLFAKHARGLMARFIIQHKIIDPEYLQGFSEEGYYFRPELSQGDEWIFTR